MFLCYKLVLHRVPDIRLFTVLVLFSCIFIRSLNARRESRENWTPTQNDTTLLPASASNHYSNPGVLHARFFFRIAERSRESVNVQSNMTGHVYGRDNYVVNDVNIRFKNRNTLRVTKFPVTNVCENFIYGFSSFGVFSLGPACKQVG